MNLHLAASILAVDENESICELVELLLGRVGYNVRTATSAADAMTIAHEMPALDVLLCGLDLPDMPGDELALCVSAIHPEAAVVFVASSYAPNDGSGSADVLEKPFTIGELRSAVRAALISRRDRARPLICATR